MSYQTSCLISRDSLFTEFILIRHGGGGGGGYDGDGCNDEDRR